MKLDQDMVLWNRELIKMYIALVDEESMDKSYIEMRNTYKKILEKLLEYNSKVIQRSDVSEEFHVLAENGEV